MHLEARKYTFPQEFFDRNSYFFYPESRQENYQHIHWLVLEHLSEIKDTFTHIPSEDWNLVSLDQKLAELNGLLGKVGRAESAEHNELRKTIKSQLQTFLRWAVSYGRSGPTITQTMEMLGRDVTLKRLQDAVASLEKPMHKSGFSTLS